MYKIMGAVIIMLSFVMFGLSKCITVKKRLKNLKKFRNMINGLRTEISFKATPLKRAAEIIGEKFSDECFGEFSKLIERFGGQKAFEMALDKYSSSYAFTSQDRSCLILMADGIGRTDRENQVRQFDYAINELDKIIKEATEECVNKTRGYLNGSVLIGAFAVLMFM